MSKVGHDLKPLTCIRKVPVSNLDLDTGYSLEVYRGFFS
jgi:hypothetical protein